MFVRKGQALGSVNHQRLAELRAERPTRKKREPAPEPTVEPEPQEQPEPQESETESVDDTGRPKDYDAKGVWVDYAVSQGADPTEAEELTKTQIIELFG